MTVDLEMVPICVKVCEHLPRVLYRTWPRPLCNECRNPIDAKATCAAVQKQSLDLLLINTIHDENMVPIIVETTYWVHAQIRIEQQPVGRMDIAVVHCDCIKCSDGKAPRRHVGIARCENANDFANGLVCVLAKQSFVDTCGENVRPLIAGFRSV